jgi:hypothetical protein
MISIHNNLYTITLIHHNSPALQEKRYLNHLYPQHDHHHLAYQRILGANGHEFSKMLSNTPCLSSFEDCECLGLQLLTHPKVKLATVEDIVELDIMVLRYGKI